MAKKLELPPRLRMVADLLPEGARLADIGTDHAYLPAALVLEGRIPSAIAADLRPGPLSRARITVRKYGLSDQITLRLCDGLRGIRPGEAQAVAIAGMGGETIASILGAAPWTRERDVALALQPMTSIPDLRLWLGQNGYRIEGEELAREGDTLYTAFSVRAGDMGPMTPAELWAGRNNAAALRGAWLDLWLGKTERALAGLARARGESGPRRRELEQVRAGLLDMKKEWEAWQR